MTEPSAITEKHIQSRIFTNRGLQVMLDSDLARLYGVENKRLNEQVKRNIERFPERFRFQLTQAEFDDLRSQFATSSMHGGRRTLPYAFTEQGISMLSAVLRSELAIKVSIQIMNEQYPPIEIKTFRKSHDRFLILDNHTIYHIGASLKDLGNKLFAFSRFDKGVLQILERLS